MKYENKHKVIPGRRTTRAQIVAKFEELVERHVMDTLPVAVRELQDWCRANDVPYGVAMHAINDGVER